MALRLFDVTQVIGSIYESDKGSLLPEIAALVLIGEHGNDGQFSFPTADGGTRYVTVETVPTSERKPKGA